jgi:hypothetical protein
MELNIQLLVQVKESLMEQLQPLAHLNLMLLLLPLGLLSLHFQKLPQLKELL